MGTITEIAQQILEEEYRPSEFTELLKDPVNFKKFQKALLDAAEEGGFVVEEDMLENDQIPEGIELPSGKTEIRALSKRGQSSLVVFLEERLAAIDPEGKWDPPSHKTIQRWVKGTSAASYEHAIKVCFALGLNDEDAAKFITAGNVSLRAFNPRSASETAYFLCLALGSTYSEARKVIEDYESNAEASDVTADDTRPNHTIVLANAVQEFFGDDERYGADAVSEYLEANRSNFLGASRTVWIQYMECKARLCFSLIARRPQDYLECVSEWLEEVGDDLKSGGVMTGKLCKCIEALWNDRENDAALNALKAEWRSFAASFRSNHCNPKLVQGHHPGGALLPSETVVDRALALGADWRLRDHEKESDDVVVSMGRWERAAKESSFPWKSDGVRMRWFFEGFPRKKYFQDIEKSEGKEIPLTQARKAIELFYFLDYSIRWSERKRAHDDVGSFGYDEFIDEDDGLNKVLSVCQLALLYPADPCDLLIMKSIRSYDPSYSTKPVNPIKYFNMTVKQSFDDQEEGPGGPNRPAPA